MEFNAQKLMSILQERNMTIKDLANKVDVEAHTIWRYFSPEVFGGDIEFLQLLQIAKALGVDVKELMTA